VPDNTPPITPRYAVRTTSSIADVLGRRLAGRHHPTRLQCWLAGLLVAVAVADAFDTAPLSVLALA
jgi:hypothetical protein